MKKLNFLLLLSISAGLMAQNNSYKFRVSLKDKGKHEYSVNAPEKFLSKRAIDRKKSHGIKIDERDFSVNPEYIAQVQKTGAKVVSHSKWFNTLVVALKDSADIQNIKKLPFVTETRYIWRGKTTPEDYSRPRIAEQKYVETDSSYFGVAKNEFALHHADAMLNAGFAGRGLVVGVIDGGFTNVDVIPYFDNIRILDVKDFVPDGYIFNSSSHGTSVLSCMATNKPGILLGSAPDASYVLLRSEDAETEFPVEEEYWVKAVEYADSIGVDIVTTSLGYNNFGDKSLSYTTADLDGKKSRMSEAADIAFEKGMLMVASAGNSGSSPWKKVTSPGDAFNIISVGAATEVGEIGKFSSNGPTADGRTKPEVVSVGVKKYTVGSSGRINRINGTSFAAPFMAGLITSLWSINPDLNKEQIIEIVKQSADKVKTPDNVYGNGIPNFQTAMKVVLKTLPVNKANVKDANLIIEQKSKKEPYTLTLQNPKFALDTYLVNVLDEDGNLLASNKFNKDKQMVVPSDICSKYKDLFFILKDSANQKVYRIQQ